VLDAVRAAGCQRLVFTSTVGVLGLAGTRRGIPADETCYGDISHLFGHYKRSKFIAEHEVLRAADCDAIRESAHWFVDNGYVSAGRCAAIRWQER